MGKQGSCKNGQAWCHTQDTKFVAHSDSRAWRRRPDTKLVDTIIANIELMEFNQLAQGTLQHNQLDLKKKVNQIN